MNDLLAPFIAIFATVIIVVVFSNFLYKIDKNIAVEVDKSKVDWLILNCPR